MCTFGHTSQNMNGLSFSLLALVLSLCIVDIEGKSGSKKGSKGSKEPCFEDPAECTDRMKSPKGSEPSMAFQIWCKEGSMEKCLAGEPKSKSIERYQLGRCDMCSLVSFPLPLFLVSFTCKLLFIDDVFWDIKAQFE